MFNSRASSLGASGAVAVVPSMSASAIVAKAASGSHILKIDGYSRTVGLGPGIFITSRSFDVGGHRWCLQYYPDGEGYNTDPGISILLCLDPSEAGEVRAQFKISLLDQGGQPVECYARESPTCITFSGKGKAHGFHDIITNAELENRYLKNDAFSVRCDIHVVMGITTEDVVIPAVEATCWTWRLRSISTGVTVV